MKHVGLYLGVVAVMGLGACSSAPSVTRTGQMKNVLITDKLSPADVTVKKGDEIRWTNRRQGAATVVFLQPIEDKLACQNGFSGVMEKMGMGNASSAKLDPNESASLCFSKPGQMRYTVRSESDLPTGVANMPGTVRVEE